MHRHCGRGGGGLCVNCKTRSNNLPGLTGPRDSAYIDIIIMNIVYLYLYTNTIIRIRGAMDSASD